MSRLLVSGVVVVDGLVNGLASALTLALDVLRQVSDY